MTRFSSLVLAALLAASSIGCGGPSGHFESGVYEDDRVRYRAGTPGAGWERVLLEQGDVSWVHGPTSAALLVNSHCEGVQDSPLESLTGDLMMGMTEREILSQKRVPWSRREALETVAQAKLDGVPRKLALFVMKKDGCVYDIVLSAPVSGFDAALPGYEALKAEFDVGPRKDRG